MYRQTPKASERAKRYTGAIAEAGVTIVLMLGVFVTAVMIVWG